MQTGFFAVGIGITADPEVVGLAARCAEECGYHSIWAPEHVVLLDQYSSKYPYTQDGRLPMPTTEIDILDPFLALTYAAALTERIRVGTGICLVPERNPLVTAKEVASLDRLSGGRFDFGVGIGWLEEEFVALGVPWERRGARTRDYLEVMKKLWTKDESDHQGEFCSFPKVRSFPKPVQRPNPPIIFGGESTAALKRVGEVGDGWFGVNVTPEAAERHIAAMRGFATAAGRDADALHYSVSTGIGAPLDLDVVKRFADLGVHQVIVGGFAATAEELRSDIERLAKEIVTPAAQL